MPAIVRLGQPPTGLGRHALICYRNFYQKTDLVNKHCAVQLGGTLTIASMLSCLYLITDNVAFQDYFYKQIFQFQFQGLGHDVNWTRHAKCRKLGNLVPGHFCKKIRTFLRNQSFKDMFVNIFIPPAQIRWVYMKMTLHTPPTHPPPRNSTPDLKR